MKPFSAKILFAVLLVLVALPLRAQEQPAEKTHSVEVGYGVLPLLQVADGVGQIFTFGAFWSEWERSDYDFLGAVNVGYSLDLNRKWQIGLTGSYSRLNVEYSLRPTDDPDPFLVGKTRIERLQSIALMPKIQFNWLNTGKCRLYTGALVGAHLLHEFDTYPGEPDSRETHVTGAFHLNMIGISFGKKVNGFVETGFGFLGLLHMGVSLKL